MLSDESILNRVTDAVLKSIKTKETEAINIPREDRGKAVELLLQTLDWIFAKPSQEGLIVAGEVEGDTVYLKFPNPKGPKDSTL